MACLYFCFLLSKPFVDFAIQIKKVEVIFKQDTVFQSLWSLRDLIIKFVDGLKLLRCKLSHSISSLFFIMFFEEA